LWASFPCLIPIVEENKDLVSHLEEISSDTSHAISDFEHEKIVENGWGLSHDDKVLTEHEP
jgi:hypothetical protein